MSKRQERLLAFFASPTSYPHRPGEVHSVETHISWVFIASPFVYKVKKPVNLGFLDFSTLEKRHHFCRRELELNRRLCPEVYLAVTAIYEGDIGFSFDDTVGEVAEYAVKMRELPHGWFLSELLAKHAVGEAEVNRVISRLHSFYESEASRSEIEEWGKPAKLKISTEENFVQVTPFVGNTLSPLAFDAIRHFTNKFYVANETLFEQRIQQRRIRDCHGDLRLDHVHLTPEATTIFDCIEFNDRFRFIDIANDLAFLAMDFDFEMQHKLGDLLLRNAAREFRDPGMLLLTDFYKCYRAFVRGKVESIQAISETTADREKHVKRAVRYFRLALRYATIGSEPCGLVVMGRIATGKSTVAKQLASELGWPIFSSDEIRKTLAGLLLTVRTPRELRAEVYSDHMTHRTYERLLKRGLAAGNIEGGVVLDATFASRAKRDFLREHCAKASFRLQVIELDADRDEIAKRLQARDKRATELSDARLEDFDKLSAAFQPPSELPGVITVSTAASNLDAVRAVLLRLAERQSVKSGSEPLRSV
jgi:aminoglycoside phosphotransferase family enzyme/predicted kinase